ncbi:hypothetical protein EDB92DRAFT_1816376 [Lactarius akahatsu]|uniref:Uncharacterized protein n=1 Tax=Lactarius akahatsu TaxID=416441 RepID=A0AAD4LF71_9AGAM|nr:hypothetical protein EDB92DRAFT_1816376 [Lactarius akahatsu]
MNTIGSAEAAKREPGDWPRDKTIPSLSLGDKYCVIPPLRRKMSQLNSRGSLTEIAVITSRITSFAQKTQPRNNGTYRVQHAINMQLHEKKKECCPNSQLPLDALDYWEQAPDETHWRGHMANLTRWQARSTIAGSSFYSIYVMDQYVWRREVYLVSLGGLLSHHEMSAPVSYHGVYEESCTNIARVYVNPASLEKSETGVVTEYVEESRRGSPQGQADSSRGTEVVAAVAVAGGLDDNEVVGAMVMGVQALSALRRPGASGLVAIASQPESVTIRIDKLRLRLSSKIVSAHTARVPQPPTLSVNLSYMKKKTSRSLPTPTPSEVAIGREEADAEKKQTL